MTNETFTLCAFIGGLFVILLVGILEFLKYQRQFHAKHSRTMQSITSMMQFNSKMIQRKKFKKIKIEILDEQGQTEA